MMDGKILKGKLALYNTREDNIDETAVTWFRSTEELNKVLEHIKEERERRKEEIEKAIEKTKKDLEKQKNEIKNQTN